VSNGYSIFKIKNEKQFKSLHGDQWSFMKRVLNRKPLSEQVAEALGEDIRDGRLKLGQMLSENQIATDLGVSRTPVREAFSHLEFQGLLVTKPQSGTFVFSPSQEDIKEIFEIRSCLELQGLQSSLKASEKTFSIALHSICEEMDSAFNAGDEDKYAKLDHQFHESFVLFSGNRLLASVYNPISLKLRALANNNLLIKMVDEVSHSEHFQIAQNFGHKQFFEVKTLMTQHLARFEGDLDQYQMSNPI
jgi:DNA-binding GntR family transcriptional regulator